jgi:hypothetical protein
LEKLLQTPPDLLMVIGGYNSSNTSHLAEMGESKLPTYFVKNAGKMVSTSALIQHWDQHRGRRWRLRDWLPSGSVTVGVTAGASCPNNLIEEVIERLFELKGVELSRAACAGCRDAGSFNAMPVSHGSELEEREDFVVGAMPSGVPAPAGACIRTSRPGVADALPAGPGPGDSQSGRFGGWSTRRRCF